MSGLVEDRGNVVPWSDIHDMLEMDGGALERARTLGRGAITGAGAGVIAAPFIATVTVTGGLAAGVLAGGAFSMLSGRRRTIRGVLVTGAGQSIGVAMAKDWRKAVAIWRQAIKNSKV